MEKTKNARQAILQAARTQLLAEGYAGMSTRKVAETAGVPLSQLHYYFGSKQRLILDLIEEENKRRLERQTSLYAEDAPLWKRYEQACDYLDDDLDSGYVRILQEMIAAGWSNPEIGESIRQLLRGWLTLLTDVVKASEKQHGAIGPFTAEELGTLIGSAFLGAEALLLLGFDRQTLPIRAALRRISILIRQHEEGGSPER